jgi:hypothetical protein
MARQPAREPNPEVNIPLPQSYPYELNGQGATRAWTAPGSRRTGPATRRAEQAHAIDAVRPGHHPGDQARDLQARVDAALPARPDALGDQGAEPCSLRQRP